MRGRPVDDAAAAGDHLALEEGHHEAVHVQRVIVYGKAEEDEIELGGAQMTDAMALPGALLPQINGHELLLTACAIV